MSRVTDIEQAVERLLVEMVDTLPAGCATVKVKRAPLIGHDGVSVWIRPANRRAAEIVVDAQNGNDTVTISAGEATPIEIIYRKGRSLAADVAEICRAIIEGHIEEELWSVDSQVIKSIARIEFGGQVHAFRRHTGLFYPFRRKERRQVRYEPYTSRG